MLIIIKVYKSIDFAQNTQMGKDYGRKSRMNKLLYYR